MLRIILIVVVILCEEFDESALAVQHLEFMFVGLGSALYRERQNKARVLSIVDSVSPKRISIVLWKKYIEFLFGSSFHFFESTAVKLNCFVVWRIRDKYSAL